MLSNGQLPHDFDENWYTDLDRHAEFKSQKSGSLREKEQKLNVKNDIVLKKQRCMSAKL
jgi:hypothetical protein